MVHYITTSTNQTHHCPAGASVRRDAECVSDDVTALQLVMQLL